MTRTMLALLAGLGTLAAAGGPAFALNPQPLPPMPRCSPPCAQGIPAVTIGRMGRGGQAGHFSRRR
jgi:hypothetical protein